MFTTQVASSWRPDQNALTFFRELDTRRLPLAAPKTNLHLSLRISVFPTPEAAAMSGFPAEHCRVLASATQGDTAFVVLDTGPAEYRYLYAGTAERVEDGWTDGTGSNGPSSGWTLTDRERGLGVAYVYDEAPTGADRVRAALGADVQETAVINGIYLVTWWRVRSDHVRTPETVAFRVAGKWVPAESCR